MAYIQFTLWEETNMQLDTNNFNKFTLKAKLAAYTLASLLCFPVLLFSLYQQHYLLSSPAVNSIKL